MSFGFFFQVYSLYIQLWKDSSKPVHSKASRRGGSGFNGFRSLHPKLAARNVKLGTRIPQVECESNL